jgi:hypothetical protein
MKTIHVYHLCIPIDFWAGWRTEAEFPQHTTADSCIDKHAYGDFRRAAMQLARGLGWDGDIRWGEGGALRRCATKRRLRRAVHDRLEVGQQRRDLCRVAVPVAVASG